MHCCQQSPPCHIGAEVKALSHAYRRQFSEAIRLSGAEDLSAMQGHVIAYLYYTREKDIFQRDVEETFNITRSSVTGIVKLMEEKGYLTRQSVPGDARLKKLTLTPKGLEHHERAMAAIEQVETEALRGFTQEEIDLFRSLCTRIRTNLSEKKE
ncbi:MAG: MarR family transcriptional regulator [Ruminiclostridium sp.]|nr:MarR family transcriptional regulator [Ruminiclostridium sp.]